MNANEKEGEKKQEEQLIFYYNKKNNSTMLTFSSPNICIILNFFLL